MVAGRLMGVHTLGVAIVRADQQPLKKANAGRLGWRPAFAIALARVRDWFSLSDAHGLLEVGIDGIEEAGGGEPGLVRSDEEGEVLRHLSAFDGIDANLLEGRRELRQFSIVIKLCAMGEAAGPGED